MQLRKLGRTGLKVSAICLGGNVFGWTCDEPTSFAVLDAFVAAGGNFIDTANSYSRWVPGHTGGESETVLGKWFKARGNRHQIILGSKAGGQVGDGPNDRGLSRHNIMNQVELSLRRLQTDYIDLYQSHYDDPNTLPEETIRTYDDLVSQGKVRYIGASNFSAWRLTRSLWASDKLNMVRYDTLQPLYNLIERDEYERELEAVCLDQGVAVIPYSALAAGFLSGKYRADRELPGSPRAAGVQRRYMNERGWAVLKVVDRLSSELGATHAQIAIAWLLARPGITAPIASATSTSQLDELVKSVDVTLNAEAIEALNQASAQ